MTVWEYIGCVISTVVVCCPEGIIFPRWVLALTVLPWGGEGGCMMALKAPLVNVLPGTVSPVG